MEELKEILAKECNYRFSMETPVMEKFLSSLTEVHLKRGGILTRYGQLDTNVYIVKSGIIKLSYFEEGVERVFAFGFPGTLAIQMHCYYGRRPSFFQTDACSKAVVMKISKQKFDEFIEESAEFARWVLDRALAQLYGLETRLGKVSGLAYERYIAVMQIMPEVVANVPAKFIASYLGVTPSYLSQLKKQYSLEMEKGRGQGQKFNPFTTNSIK